MEDYVAEDKNCFVELVSISKLSDNDIQNKKKRKNK
jgi:hypothetical protein